MQDLSLRERLRSFCEEAAMQLAHDAAGGEDVPFELVDESGADGPPLWCHRTLTGEFIRRRIGVLGMLPGYRPAAEALERVEGLDEWLLAHGEQHVPASARDRSDATLRVFLAEVLGESASFQFDGERFETTWSALDALLFEGRTAVLLAAPLYGVEIESDELRFVDDTLLVSNRSVEAEALPGDIFRGDGLPVTVALVEADDPSPESLGQARQKLRRLLCALRLFGDASPALGGAARMQVARGPWQVLGLEGSGSARGTLVIGAEQEVELTEFCSLVSRRWPRGGEIAWALRRHEFGCDRLHYSDSLSDHLLALRALLEPEGPASGRLTQRLAALCALPDDRARLAERTARAVALERSAVTGISGHEPEAEALSREIEGHLRALVRDVICGHLDSDLRGLADSIIAESVAPSEVGQTSRSGRSADRRRFGEPDSLAA